MKSLYKLSLILLLFTCITSTIFAGNPDRQGEAGAAELLLNPWARSAGLHTMNTSSITGIEAMRLNIAGLSRISGREVVLANTRLYEGADVRINAFGFANKMGENGTIGVSLMSMDFGEIPVTTTISPEGTGADFSPSFFNLGLGYSYLYDNKISVGLLVRGVSESIADVSAFGLAIDAGVQYVAGENDNFKLGISLRNVGSRMRFSGQGLAFSTTADNGVVVTADQQASNFEMPSMLNLGLSYDFYFDQIIVRGLGNFTSNAFSRDQIGAGAEVMFKDLITLRAAYRQEIGDAGAIQDNLYTGLAAGISLDLPFNKAGSSKIGIDYAYRATSPYRGTHNFSIRLAF